MSAKWWVGDWGEGRSLKLKIVGVQESTAFGQELATYQFKDTDGVEVIASLYADQDGNPFELDVWKVDFTPVMRLPE